MLGSNKLPGSKYNNADFIKFSKQEWIEFLSGWRDGDGELILNKSNIQILSEYLPIITGQIFASESIIWFPANMTSKECIQAQLDFYNK